MLNGKRYNVGIIDWDTYWSKINVSIFDNIDTRIVGSSYYNMDVWKKKKTGNLVVLVPEPGNPYDPNAIAVYAAIPTGNDGNSYDWTLVGHVEKHMAQHLNAMALQYILGPNWALEAHIRSRPDRTTDIELNGVVRMV